MNKLAKSLLVGLLENESRVVALYGGGFKPPTKGHFQVAKKTLEDHPEIDKLYIVIGKGLRDNISQDESYSIWNIYKKYLGNKIEIIKSDSPISYIKKYIQDNPEENIYAVLGTREGDEGDIKDFNQRKEFFEKYGNNVTVLNIITGGGISGTKARKSISQSKEELLKYIPDVLSDKEKDIIWGYMQSTIQENITTDSNSFDYPTHIKSLTKHMLNNGLNIKPLPKVKFINDDHENAQNFFGKTAYYDPNQKLIVLYTLNRHPKDVMRSFSHEMIHHMQNCEGRLQNITTQNTNEEGDLPEIEREAYEEGNMLFRGWTDTITEGVLKEGRYDKISNVISSYIFKRWKYYFENEEDPIFASYTNFFQTDEFAFELEAILNFEKTDKPLKINGHVEDKENKAPLIYIEFSVDPSLLPKMWEKISMSLKDVVRHEIEHLTQTDEDIFPSKFIEDDQHIRSMIHMGLLNPSHYMQLEKEVDANLQGLYFRAKKEKLPFSQVINDYLDSQDITPQEKKEVLDVWRRRLPALNLPKF